MFDVPLNSAECRRVLFLLWSSDQTLGVSQVRSHTRESVNAVTVGTDQSLFLVAIDQTPLLQPHHQPVTPLSCSLSTC